MKLLTPVSDIGLNALSDGNIHFALYGSSFNHKAKASSQKLSGWREKKKLQRSLVNCAGAK